MQPLRLVIMYLAAYTYLQHWGMIVQNDDQYSASIAKQLSFQIQQWFDYKGNFQTNLVWAI